MGNYVFNLKSFVISTLRRASYRNPSRTEALRQARRQRNAYVCAACRSTFTRKEVQVDHITPIVPLTGWVSWESFIDRLFLGALQVLCKPCHKSKTQEENRVRRANKPKARKRKRAKSKLHKSTP